MAELMLVDADSGESVRVNVSHQPLAGRDTPIDPQLAMAAAPDSASAAGYRVLRHRLARAGDPRVVVVTSAVAREGKSTCAANLALAFAEEPDARVLLVEANLRAPSLAQLFGVTPPECFATQMMQHRTTPRAPWSLVEVSPSLHLAVTLGAPAGAPLHLDSAALDGALTALKEGEYHHILVDAPPVLGSADVNLLDRRADALLFTVLIGHTQGRDLALAIEQLQSPHVAGLAVLGA